MHATFGALIEAQAMHSIEEYAGRLYEIFPPARLMCGLVSADLRRGFIIINVLFVAFGVWCYLRPLRGQWVVAPALALGYQVGLRGIAGPPRIHARP